MADAMTRPRDEPDAARLQDVLNDIQRQISRRSDDGKPPDYIKPLAAIDPGRFGIVVALNSGGVVAAGEPFSIQSISKVFAR